MRWSILPPALFYSWIIREL